MKSALVICALLIAAPTHAAERAVILNDAEVNALIDLIDSAVKARGLQVAKNAVILSEKIMNAPVVTERKDDMPKEDKQ